ncbi:MAG: hypothetical protein JWO38_2089 [Gemmataceae bacterium]|nr:hypothetical protein [Gemmataceae bacterium]
MGCPGPCELFPCDHILRLIRSAHSLTVLFTYSLRCKSRLQYP